MTALFPKYDSGAQNPNPFGDKMNLRLDRFLFTLIVSLILTRSQMASAQETTAELENLLPQLHLLAPFWGSEVVYRESAVFVDEGDGKPSFANLLFKPVRIVSVETADGSQRFEDGKDFTVAPDGRGLLRIGSRIPVIPAADLFPPKNSQRSLPAKADDPDRNILFDNQHWFHDQQVQVTYIRASDAWQGPTPGFRPEALPKTIAKLKRRKPITIGVSGDSISAGFNASGYTKAPPFMPPYPELIAAELRYLYGGTVKLLNRSVAGWDAGQGLRDLDNLLKEKPDLVIVAYGMNDVSHRDPQQYRSQIRQIIEKIQSQNHDIEIVLVAPMLGNGKWAHTPFEMFPCYRDELKKLSGPGVPLVDLTSLWEVMMKRKRHIDITGNGVNHPNDFGHRIYASAILSLLAEPEVMKAAQPAAPADVTRRITLPDGFHATLFANEPDVVQPIAFTFDDRGRMWVVECRSYPQWKDGRKDRVLILEDTDNDGVADVRKVFWDQGTNLTGIAYGFGGIWLCSVPNLIFVPDENRDDIPDSDPSIKLDGWDLESQHNAFNGLTWGPDGWLYGCNGILSNSLVGPPGVPDDKRIPINCGIWRYHPTQGRFEAVAHGTTNPWGLAFDDHGEMFLTNCVIKHLFHVIPGGHYVRMFGQDMNPGAYRLLESCADHIHWAGGHWTESRGGNTHDSFGGGHAHSGAAIYLGDMFPPEYRNRIFMCNIHGNRVNQDTLERQGSGYVAHHAKDFLRSSDPWFRGVAVHVGPDGALYVSDWSDTGECHNYVVADRSNGRILRIAYGKPKGSIPDLTAMTDRELIDLQSSTNDWHVRTARRILQERSINAGIATQDKNVLVGQVSDRSLPGTQRLRSLWALFSVGGFADETARLGFADSDEDIRGWTVRLSVDSEPTDTVNQRLVALSAAETSPRVQLSLASALQRLQQPDRLAMAHPLVERITNADDPNLPAMLWFGIEPLVAADPSQGIAFAKSTVLPSIRQSIVRRIADLAEDDPSVWPQLFELLASSADMKRRDYLLGLEQSLEGRRNVTMPSGWNELYATLTTSLDQELVSTATRVALVFNDPTALQRLISTVEDATATDASRIRALAALIQAKPPTLIDVLAQTLDIPALRLITLRGLATSDDDRVAPWILQRFGKLEPSERDAAVTTLAARAGSAHQLLDAMADGMVPRSAITAYHIQQLQTLSDREVLKKVTENWGAARQSAEGRLVKIQELKSRLTDDEIEKGDVSQGRVLFKKNCSSCHKLFDDGGAVGPELTGSQRFNLDYVLQNVIDPSAVVPRDYQMQLFLMVDGRTINGIVKQENDHTVVVQTTNELLSIPVDEIDDRSDTGLSMMPDGLWATLSPSDWRDLICYLRSDHQVPLPSATDD